MATILDIRELYKRFEPGPWVIEGFSLSVQAGTLMYVLGPSGCGKTTLLRLVAGFESPDAGAIVKEGETISRPGRVLPPEARRIGMVFQDYALFPHLTVEENVRFGLESRGLLPLALGLLPGLGRLMRPGPFAPGSMPNGAPRPLGELYELTGLAGLERRYPHELSGGQQQRVALARALARQPDLVLLDEPFSNLDASLRQRIREEMRMVLRRSGATSLLVTHDQEEAINLADRIAVMSEGRLQQVGTPDEILHRPRNRFVASFLGPSDFIPGTVNGDRVETELGAHPLPPDLLAPTGTPVEVQLRPDHFEFCENGEGAEAHVVGREFQGVSTLYKLALPSGVKVQANLPGYLELSPGDRVRVRFHPPVLVCFPARRT
jgi:iron(III) transport system ATP-binding protein